MRHEHFRITRPVGTGHSRENDVRRIRRALHETGYITAPPDPSGHYNAGAIAAIERFQRDHGLKEDGVVLPGGPTERVLELALAARREGGADSQTQLRDLLHNAADAGLSFVPGAADDERPGAFVDRDGEFASPERLRELLTPRNDDGTRGDEVRVANAAVARGVLLPAADGLAALSRAVAGLIGGAAAAEIFQRTGDEWQRVLAGDPVALRNLKRSRDDATAQIRARAAVRRDRTEAARMADESGQPTLPGQSTERKDLPPTPGFPANPPGLNDHKAENIPEDVEDASVLAGGTPESAKPEKFIFEALPDDEFWRRIHIVERAGSPRTRLYNHKTIGRFYERGGPTANEEFKILGGGYPTRDPATLPRKQKYRREFRLKAHKSLEVPGKPTKNSSYADIAIQHTKTGKIALINTQTRNKDDSPTSAERWQSKKMLVNKKTEDLYVEVGKPRPGQSLEERLDEYNDLFDEIIRKLRTPKKGG